MYLIYLKPTNYCNVGCEHCFLSEDIRADKDKMSLETVEKVAYFLKEATEKTAIKDVNILWHGGEPLLMPVDFYWKAGEILDRILPNHTESIQTSLIPYKPEFKDLILQRFDGFISSSVDFSNRKLKNSPFSYQELWLKKLEQARNDGIDMGVVCTPTKMDVMLAKERMDWFLENDLYSLAFNRYNQFGVQFGQFMPDRPNNKEHAQFLIKIFDYLVGMLESEKENIPYIQTVNAAFGGVLYDLPGDRWGTKCQSSFMVIEPDGNLNTCPDKASFEPAFSNVESGFDGFSHSPLRRKWIRVQEVGHRNDYCHKCENHSWCKSGCPITPNSGGDSGEIECSGYKSFLTHIRNYINTSSDNRDRIENYFNGKYFSREYKKMELI